MIEYSFVVPVYNESEILMDFYHALSEVVNNLDKKSEVIFVTGGNTDTTLFILKEIAARDDRIKVINMSARFNYQAALTAGLDYSSGNAVVTMDGDLQHPPELIPELIREWQRGHDIVYTVRESTIGESFFKKNGSKFFYFLLKRLTRIDFDTNCADFRLLSRKAVNVFKTFTERERFIPGIISSLGFNKTGVRYTAACRNKGKTKFNLFKMVSLAIDGILSYTILPIRLVTLIGFSMTLISFLYLAVVIFYHIFHPEVSPSGWASIIASVLFLSSIQITILGLLGEYIGRIYEETKHRPIYIVDELIGFEQSS